MLFNRCYHIVGYYNNYDDSHLIKNKFDENFYYEKEKFEPFNYCPECGTELINKGGK